MPGANCVWYKIAFCHYVSSSDQRQCTCSTGKQAKETLDNIILYTESQMNIQEAVSLYSMSTDTKDLMYL